MTKTCCKCKQDKNISEFTQNKSKKDGLNPSCRTCHKLYTAQHYQANKAYYKRKAEKNRPQVIKDYKVWYYALKSKYPCERCGESHPACIDFHHVNPDDKLHNISYMYKEMMSKQDIEDEIKKCIALCANCHRKEHFNQRQEILGCSADSGAKSTKLC